MAELHGYVKGDLRRMFSVLAAIEELGDQATIVRIARATGLDNHSVTTQFKVACEQARVVIAKEGKAYQVRDWGPILKKEGVKQVLVDLRSPLIQAEITRSLNERASRRKQAEGRS